MDFMVNLKWEYPKIIKTWLENPRNPESPEGINETLETG